MGLGLGRAVLQLAAKYGSDPVRNATQQKRAASGAIGPDPGLSVLFGGGAPPASPAPPSVSYGPPRTPPVAPPVTPKVPTQPTGPTADELWANFVGQKDGAPIIFGRTPDGKYAGWGTRSDMQDAVAGYADMWRTQALDEAQQLQDNFAKARDEYATQAYDRMRDANGQISQKMPTYDAFGQAGLDAAYADYVAKANALSHGHNEGLLSKADFAKQHISSGANIKWNAPSTGKVLVSRTQTSDGRRFYPEAYAPGEQTYYPDLNPPDQKKFDATYVPGVEIANPTYSEVWADAPNANQIGYTGQQMWDAARQKAGVEPNYQGRVSKWQQDSMNAWDPYLQVADNVEQMTPRDWALASASKYGLSPDVANGIFDPAWGNSQDTALRDQTSWDKTGQPYNEYQSAQEKAAAAAQKAQEDATYNAASDAFFQALNIDLKQAADGANLTTDQALQVASSPAFRDAYAKIIGVDPFSGAATGQAPLIDGATGKVDEGNLMSTMRDLYVTQPAVYRLLVQALGKDIFPTGVNNPLYDTTG